MTADVLRCFFRNTPLCFGTDRSRFLSLMAKIYDSGESCGDFTVTKKSVTFFKRGIAPHRRLSCNLKNQEERRLQSRNSRAILQLCIIAPTSERTEGRGSTMLSIRVVRFVVELVLGYAYVTYLKRSLYLFGSIYQVKWAILNLHTFTHRTPDLDFCRPCVACRMFRLSTFELSRVKSWVEVMAKFSCGPNQPSVRCKYPREKWKPLPVVWRGLSLGNHETNARESCHRRMYSHPSICWTRDIIIRPDVSSRTPEIEPTQPSRYEILLL